jgi:glycosyltransferase involved in cell wall biosynthesis
MADYADRLCGFYRTQTGFKTCVITEKNAERPGTETDKRGVKIYRVVNAWAVGERQAVLKLIEKESPGVVHLQYHENDFDELDMVCSLLPEVKRRFPRIKTVASLASFDLGSAEGRHNVSRIIAGGDFITLTTDHDYDLIRKEFKQAGNRIFKVYDRPNIISGDGLKADNGGIRKRFGIDADAFLFVNFGFINPDKGFETIFRALKDVLSARPDAKFLVIGELHHGGGRSGKYLKSLKELAARLNIEKNVVWAGHLPDADTSGVLSACDAAIMPFRDGLSGKRSSFWSVLDHSLPAITTYDERNPLPEGIKDGENVLLIPCCDANKLAEAACRLMNDAGLRGKLGRNAKKLARTRYSWKKLIEELLTIYSMEARA